MSEVHGTKELKELLKFVVSLGMALDKALVDKKFELHEVALFMGPMMLAGDAFTGLETLGEEIKDLSVEEAHELVEFVKVELKLENDKVEEIVEKALELGANLYGFVKLFKKKEA